MTGKEKLKLAIEHIDNTYILHPSGEPFPISVYSLPRDIRSYTFKAILKKFAEEFEAIRILKYPYDIDGCDYDPHNDTSTEIQNSFVIELLDKYKSLRSEILSLGNDASKTPDYIPYYIKIMFQVIDELNINEDNQPIKDNIVEWLRDNYPELGKTETEYLATFVRSPDRKKGGFHR